MHASVHPDLQVSLFWPEPVVAWDLDIAGYYLKSWALSIATNEYWIRFMSIPEQP